MILIFFLCGVSLGAIVGFVAVHRLYFGCHWHGHDWERCQVDGAHCRDPASAAFRMCKRCAHTEWVEPPRLDGDLPGIEPT